MSILKYLKLLKNIYKRNNFNENNRKKFYSNTSTNCEIIPALKRFFFTGSPYS